MIMDVEHRRSRALREDHRHHNLCISDLQRPVWIPRRMPQHRRKPCSATRTPTHLDDGPCWQCPKADTGSTREFRGHHCPAESLRRPRTAAPLSTFPAPTHKPRPHLTRSRGRRPAWCWAVQAWLKLRECYAANIGWNYWRANQVFQADPREHVLACSDDGFKMLRGTWYSSWHTNILQPNVANTGLTGSFKRLTKGARAEAHQRPEPACSMLPLARPRSLCTCRFQHLPTLHPHGPSLPCPKRRPRRSSPDPHIEASQDRTPNGTAQRASAKAPSEGALSVTDTHTCRFQLAETTQWHPVARHTSSLVNQSGPKSGSCLLTTVCISMLAQAGGVRVPSDSTSGGGLAVTTARKQRGTSPPRWSAPTLQPPVSSFTRSVKRAYRRAQNRAKSSLNQGTWYRGRWHTTESLGRLSEPLRNHPRRVQPQPPRGRRLTPHLQVFSWNASGLSSAMFQELMAWCEVQADLDAIIIQETHWHETSDFCTGQWLAMHTSGRHMSHEHGRCSGILFLLHRRRLQDPRIVDIVPGRLALVQATSKQTQLPVSIIGLYQHVWRSNLPTARNLELRRGLWQHLDKHLLSIPQRHHLLICGDFNSTVRSDSTTVGCSVPTGATPPDSDLAELLVKHSLCVLNTWHNRKACTFYSPQGSTQIDFIITRQNTAHLQAKRAYSDHTFPVGGSRLSGHYPVRAQLPMQSYHKLPSQDGPATPPIDLPALQTAVCHNTPEAQQMQECIAVRLQQVDVTNLVSVHRHVNRILLEAATAAFPKQPPADHRVSAQPAFRVTAKSVWHMYRNLKRPRVCTPHEIFAKWKLAASFARASKILRKQSQSLKKQFYESQVDQAEHAANNNDQRSLFLIIKRLSPKNRNIACRLRGSDGHLLTGPEQMQRIVAYGNETFAAKDDDHPRIPLTTALQISAQDIAQELRKLGVSKAVPRHIAPAAVWKQCSQDLGQILSHAICHHMQPGTSGELDEDWKSSYVVWIPKPGKPQLDVASLRPIGLSSPASKALAGSLRQHLLRGLEPALRTTPQFAYAKSRGTADALLRAHMHFEAVTQLVQNTQCTRFQKQAGGKEREVVGGLSLSLDLSKAFDGVTRAHIYNSMAQRGVPQDVITIIQQLHYRAQYVYQTGTQSGSTTTSNGIKQGCVIAPYLWNYFSLAYLSMLQDRRSEAWVQQVLTLFADDVWGAWEIRNARDLDQAIADVSLVLEALETLNMTINYSKTAILLKLVGKDAQRLKQQHTFMKAGQLHLRVSVHGRECGIPIKDQHEYLGTIVTYRHRHQRNMQHRLKACLARYQGLRKLLNGSHHLAVHHRLRLWQACICTSAFYAQHIVGVTSSTIATLTTTSRPTLHTSPRARSGSKRIFQCLVGRCNTPSNSLLPSLSTVLSMHPISPPSLRCCSTSNTRPPSSKPRCSAKQKDWPSFRLEARLFAALTVRKLSSAKMPCVFTVDSSMSLCLSTPPVHPLSSALSCTRKQVCLHASFARGNSGGGLILSRILNPVPANA